MTDERAKTLTDLVIDSDEKDVSKLLLRIALSVDKVSENTEKMNERFDNVNERLLKGDKIMTGLKEDVSEIKTNIQQLDCKRPASECKLPERKGTGFILGVITTIATIGAGSYAAFDSIKPYAKEIYNVIIKIKGAN